jgi:hypothetical protein
MDPKACLRRAATALADGDPSGAEAALDDFREWRRRGGFEPTGGDEAARLLGRLVESQRRQGVGGDHDGASAAAGGGRA